MPLVTSEMAITPEFKLCLSNFSSGIEIQKGYKGRNFTLTFTRPIDLFLMPYFDRFSPIFETRLMAK